MDVDGNSPSASAITLSPNLSILKTGKAKADPGFSTLDAILPAARLASQAICLAFKSGTVPPAERKAGNGTPL